jgi:hypothetical protein
MAFSLDGVRGELSKGVARSSHYELIIGPESIKYRAISLTAPGRQITATPSGVYGAVQEIGYAALYAPVSTTIYCSPDHSERKYFTEWQDEIVGTHRLSSFADESQFNAGYYDSYVKDVSIKQYDETGSKTHEIKLIEAYPRNVGELNYTYQTNELLVFTVSFQYRYFNE